jgi:hypothetical protein
MALPVASYLSAFKNSLTGDIGAAAQDILRIGAQSGELGSDSVVAVPIFFQYFPASITENRNSGIETIPTNGFTLPIPTFSGPMPRSIGMRVTFSRERWTPGAALAVNSWDKYNVDVAVAVKSLRALSYPIGTGDIATVGVTPQPFKLVLPGVGLGVTSDSIYCFLESYAVEYAAFFPDGQPRLAHVDLAMQEMLIDLSENVTGRSFQNALATYSRGAAKIFKTDQNQEVRGRTEKMDVSTNRLG